MKNTFNPLDFDREWFHSNPEQAINIRPLMPEELEDTEAEPQALSEYLKRFQVFTEDGLMKTTHVVVVDLAKMSGVYNSESMSVRIPCPEPANKKLNKSIRMSAIIYLMSELPSFREVMKARLRIEPREYKWKPKPAKGFGG